MYIRTVQIRNIKSLSHLDMEFPDESAVGWHVILGDNGSGKSTLLRSIALCLVGPEEALRLPQNWDEWIGKGSEAPLIKLSLVAVPGIRMAPDGTLPVWVASPALQFQKAPNSGLVPASAIHPSDDPEVWSGKSPWFSASFGPFRRFRGGVEFFNKILQSKGLLAPHLSVFDEGVAFAESLKWLQFLQFQRLEMEKEGRPDGGLPGALLDRLKDFVNRSDCLPHGTQLKSIHSDRVEFVDGEGHAVRVEELSDGYRSVLSLAFELIRQLSNTYELDQIFDLHEPLCVKAPGVVLIDEPDAHLHPTWQQRIGSWFRKHFPRIQFIVATHSPLICQAAEVGTVWKLPRPGSEEVPRRIEGVELQRLVYGSVFDAYGSGVFGTDVTRSESSMRLLEKLAELNQKELREGVSEGERQEMIRLRAILPTDAYTTSPAEFE